MGTLLQHVKRDEVVTFICFCIYEEIFKTIFRSFFFNRCYISVIRVWAFSTVFFHSFLFCIIFIQFITFIDFKSFTTPSSHLPNFLDPTDFHLKTFLTYLCFDILFVCPNEPNLNDFIWFIYLLAVLPVVVGVFLFFKDIFHVYFNRYFE